LIREDTGMQILVCDDEKEITAAIEIYLVNEA
jgi:DNA-binding response OmpR family regulator